MAAPTEKLGMSSGRTGKLQLHFQMLFMWLFPVVFSCKMHLLLAGIGTSVFFYPWPPVSAVSIGVPCEVGIEKNSRTLGQSPLIKVIWGSLMSPGIEIKTISTSYPLQLLFLTADAPFNQLLATKSSLFIIFRLSFSKSLQQNLQKVHREDTAGVSAAWLLNGLSQRQSSLPTLWSQSCLPVHYQIYANILALL